jgi:hypothetical protein
MYAWYHDPQLAYVNDVFIGNWNLLSETLDVVVHEWAPNLNMCMKKIDVHIGRISL